MTRSAHDIAAELRRRLPGLTVTKMHKLLYYCQGHHLAQVGEELFTESVTAWDKGPVVGRLWFEEREQGAPAQGPDLTDAELNTVGYVISRYGTLTAGDLVRLTHSERPWQEADAKRTPGGRARIPTEAMRSYFANEGAFDADLEELLPDTDALRDWLAAHSERPMTAVKVENADDLRAAFRIAG